MGVVAGASLFSISCNDTSKDSGWNESNAFYQESTLPYKTADFSKIQNKDFKPALEEGMRQQMEAVNAIAANTEKPTFENTLVALEKSSALLDRANRAFNVLTGAHTNKELQAISAELAPKFAAHSDAIYLNDALFQRIKTINDNRASLGLDNEDKRLVAVYFEKFVAAGANLNESDKAKLKEINQELASLSNAFGEKLLAATKSGGVTFTAEELDGVGSDELNSMKQGDNQYLVPLNNTTQQPIFPEMNNRDARAKLYKESWIRAEKKDDNDTRSTLLALAHKRAEKAKLLGFDNYAAWNLQSSMAQTPENAENLLRQLSEFAVANAKEEEAAIQQLIDESENPFQLSAADWDYYAEKIRSEKYALNQNELKPYFEMNSVLENGVFFMATKMYGITFKERKDIPVWHEDVKVYEIFNEDGSPVGLFYADLYQRDSKRGGAWMSNIVGQSKLLDQLPVIYNVSNFNKPAAGQPTLLTQDNVVTMFHEFGHAIHGFFAEQKYPTLSGTNVSRDFVEFPSQFHEHFAMMPEVLNNYAKHYKTGEVIPGALIEKLKLSQNFNKGYALTELMGASTIDMAWHTISAEAKIDDVDAFELEALSRNGLNLATVPPRYRSSYFSHIFSGGYAAGYYSYQWAEMLDWDAFAWLEENGGMNRANGQFLRERILSKGNSVPLDELYRNFRGKNPSIDAFLFYKGFAK
ncbi:peptidyl-dipeptidase Dcp [Myroides guanonis]|uniref:Peptidyl-dipeptidase Dcp n=2 Tax=Myroides guanonis TaxID=1150112 RepID=A0A1I3SQR6_9FLAO|nr:peptidyl-dipeptidase Dcp [Myroides guanonis]